MIREKTLILFGFFVLSIPALAGEKFLPPPAPNAPSAPHVPSLPQKPEVGMHHVRVTDPKPDSAQNQSITLTKPESKETPTKLKENDPNILKDFSLIPNTALSDEKIITGKAPKVYFTPASDLHAWKKISALMSGANTKTIDDAIKEVESSPANISPSGLFLAAGIYTQRGDLKRAAQLYYLAQLRAQFDKLRWPKPSPSSSRQDAELFKLAELYGPPINSWVMADSKRLQEIVNEAKKMDEKTPYSYHPGHTLAFGRDEKEWPLLHTKAREIFSTESQKIIDSLKTLGR